MTVTRMPHPTDDNKDNDARRFYEKMGGKISDNKIMVIDNVPYDVSTYLWDL